MDEIDSECRYFKARLELDGLFRTIFETSSDNEVFTSSDEDYTARISDDGMPAKKSIYSLELQFLICPWDKVKIFKPFSREFRLVDKKGNNNSNGAQFDL